MPTELERISALEQIVMNQSKLLEEIAADVKSLLGSRSFARGAVWLAGGISAVVSFIVALWKHA